MEKIQIEQIRHDLTWRIRHEAMYPDKPYDTIKLEDDPNGIHFGLFTDGQLVTVISIFEEGTIYQFRKFATLPAAQGKGYGSLMLQHIIAYVSNIGATKLWCNARTSASAFYMKLGFSETDKRFSKHGFEFFIMKLQLNN
jgi:GNAT superfamily N-acetyltransferase